MNILGRIRHNLGLKVLSLALALIIWGLVHNQTDPIVVRHRTMAVEAVEVPQHLAVSAIEPSQVSVILEGRLSALQQLDYSGFRMVARVTQTQVGSVRTELEPVSPPPNVEVRDFSPKSVRVTLDAVVTASRPVFVELRGDPAEGFTVGQTQVRPRSVTISGPSNQVQRVARVVAEVDISGRNTTGPSTVTLAAQDAASLLVPAVQISPSQATVTVQIRQVDSRTVPIVPVVGSVPRGYEVDSVTLRPVVVTVTGPSQQLTAVDSIQTAPINVARRGRTSFTVPLRLPSGLKSIGPASAQVTVTVRASGGRAEQPEATEVTPEPEPAPEPAPPAKTPPAAKKAPAPPATSPPANGDQPGEEPEAERPPPAAKPKTPARRPPAPTEQDQP